MIVQIRGGSGAGKSTMVRRWIEEHGEHTRYMMANAGAWGLAHIDCPPSRPFALGFEKEKVIVVGHYDSTGGGGDMIKSVTHIYDVAVMAALNGQNVLLESLFCSKDSKHTHTVLLTAKSRSIPAHIIQLDVPEEVCYQSVQARRAALGKEERFLKAHANDWKSAHPGMEKHLRSWEEEGLCSVYRLSRDDAAAKLRELLG